MKMTAVRTIMRAIWLIAIVQLAVATSAAPVSVQSKPSQVTVWMGDLLLGQTPCTLEFATEGEVELCFKATGCEPLTQKVELGKLTSEGTLSVNLKPRQDAVVTIRCESHPKGADVYLDGERRGVTPLELTGVPRRAAELRFSRAERETVIRQLDFSKGDERRVISVTLPSVLESNYRRMIQQDPYNIHHYADLGHHLVLEGELANAVETLGTGLRLLLDGKMKNANESHRLWSEVDRIINRQYDYGDNDVVQKARQLVYELLTDLYGKYADAKALSLYIELITCARSLNLKDTADQVLERALAIWPKDKTLQRMQRKH